jgi:hypothetical protein
MSQGDLVQAVHQRRPRESDDHSEQDMQDHIIVAWVEVMAISTRR